MSSHGGALESDLMRTTRFTLDDLGGELSENALLSFSSHLPAESALVAEVDELGGWSRTEQLLARLVEAVEILDWHFCCKGAKKSKWPKPPRRIERPGVKDGEERRIGKEPIPIKSFDEWYYGGDA